MINTKIHNPDYFWALANKIEEGYLRDSKHVDNLYFLNWLIDIWVFIILHFLPFTTRQKEKRQQWLLGFECLIESTPKSPLFPTGGSYPSLKSIL